VKLDTAGSQSATASDATACVSGSATGIVVSPAAATQIVFTQGPAPGIAGQALNVVQATAEDSYGNIITGYSGLVTMGVQSGPGTFTSGSTTTANAQNGVATFSNLVFNIAGNHTLSAAATGLTAATSGLISISPASFQLAAPSLATAGTAFSVTVMAYNADGTSATAYRGTVHFTNSDGQAVLPADYAFTAADQGAHTFTVTLETAGSQSRRRRRARHHRQCGGGEQGGLHAGAHPRSRRSGAERRAGNHRGSIRQHHHEL
jgi:hypothetical protein